MQEARVYSHDGPVRRLEGLSSGRRSSRSGKASLRGNTNPCKHILFYSCVISAPRRQNRASTRRSFRTPVHAPVLPVAVGCGSPLSAPEVPGAGISGNPRCRAAHLAADTLGLGLRTWRRIP
eukprot:5486419-Pyramimonas_sp.AAC.1